MPEPLRIIHKGHDKVGLTRDQQTLFDKLQKIFGENIRPEVIAECASTTYSYYLKLDEVSFYRIVENVLLARQFEVYEANNERASQWYATAAHMLLDRGHTSKRLIDWGHELDARSRALADKRTSVLLIETRDQQTKTLYIEQRDRQVGDSQ